MGSNTPDIREIYRRVDGLGYTPKHLRREKFEKLQAKLAPKQAESDAIRKELQSLSTQP